MPLIIPECEYIVHIIFCYMWLVDEENLRPGCILRASYDNRRTCSVELYPIILKKYIIIIIIIIVKLIAEAELGMHTNY